MEGIKRGIDSYPTYGHQTLLAKLLERHGGEVREAALRPLYGAITAPSRVMAALEGFNGARRSILIMIMGTFGVGAP